jgi:predicted RNase H-related nuclease YkuK (DUF458 family)
MNEWLSPSGDEMDGESVLQMLNREGEIHVGSDSHLVGGMWLFATAVCVYNEGKGGAFCYRRVKFPKASFKGLYDRLMQETTLSILAAEEIKTLVEKRVTIHADVATSDTASSRYRGQVESFIKSMGFPVVTKPESWASSSIADKKAR